MGMRLDDAFQAFRERRARAAGHVPHVLPYTGYGSTDRVRVLARVIMTKPGADQDDYRPWSQMVREGIRGWRNFVSATAPGAVVDVDVNGTRHQVTADRGGVVDIDLPVDLEPGWNVLHLSCEGSEAVEADVYVVPDGTRFGIISDVDDTVMVTALPRPMLAAWNSFVVNEHARMSTPGMAVMMERVVRAHPGAPTVYLSTGAWNVAQALTRFLTRNLYPAGALLLTDWGPTPERWFRSGGMHKRVQLERLVREFPDIKWLLVGDDGQHDEMIYSGFVERYPGHVAAVVIRQLSVSEAVLAGGRSQLLTAGRAHAPGGSTTGGSTPATAGHSGSAVPWIYAPDGAGIADRLTELGLIAGSNRDGRADASGDGAMTG